MLILNLEHYDARPDAEEIVIKYPDRPEIVVRLLRPLRSGSAGAVRQRIGIEAPREAAITRRPVCLKEAAQGASERAV